MSSEAASSSAKCSGEPRWAACECKAGLGHGLRKFKRELATRGATSHLGCPQATCGPVTVGTISATMANRTASEAAGPSGRGGPLPDRADGLSRLASRFAGRSDPDLRVPGAPRGRFGEGALKVRGRIFALRSGGKLEFRLPERRVRELIAQGDGVPFTAGGAPVRGWVAVPAHDSQLSEMLAEEAFGHVLGLGPG